MEVKFEKTIKLDDDDLSSIFSCWEEYWSYIIVYEEEFDKAKRDLIAKSGNERVCLEDVWYQHLLNGGSIHFYEIDGLKIWDLDFSKLVNGIKMYMEKGGEDPCEWDGISYDCIVQYGLFGELVYG